MSDARKAEAKSNVAQVEFRGRTFTVPRKYDDWTVDLLESIEEGKSVGIVRGALGPKQWQEVRGMNLLVKDLDELSDAIVKALGFDGTGE